MSLDLALYAPYIFNFIASTIIFFVMKKKINKKLISKDTGKEHYSTYVFIIGIFSGTLLTFGLFSLAGTVMGGHYGLFFISFIILSHIIFSLILSIIGRIILGWKTIIY